MSRSAADRSLLPPLWILTTAGCVGLLSLAILLKEIMVLLLLGYCIAYLIEPLVAALERRGLARTYGVIFVFIALVLLLLLLALTAVPTILREGTRLLTELPQFLETARIRGDGLLAAALPYLPERFRSVLSGEDSIISVLPSIPPGAAQGVVQAIVGTALSGYSLTLTIINLTLLPFFAFYLSADFVGFHQRIVELFPVLYRGRFLRLMREINFYVSAFVRGQCIVGTILFCCYALGLSAIGVELWFLLAVISGFGSLVPFLGFAAGIVLSSIMALVTFGDAWHLVQVWALYGALQFLEGFVITPRVVGDRVGLSPLVVILALLIGGQLFGLLGIMLAVPGAAALRVIGRRFHGWLVMHL